MLNLMLLSPASVKLEEIMVVCVCVVGCVSLCVCVCVCVSVHHYCRIGVISQILIVHIYDCMLKDLSWLQ